MKPPRQKRTGRDFAKQQGDLDGAITDASKVLTLKPGNPDAYFNRGLAKQEKRDWNGAIADYDKVIAQKPDEVDAYRNRGNTERENGVLGGALADHNKAIRFKPGVAWAQTLRLREHSEATVLAIVLFLLTCVAGLRGGEDERQQERLTVAVLAFENKMVVHSRWRHTLLALINEQIEHVKSLRLIWDTSEFGFRHLNLKPEQ